MLRLSNAEQKLPREPGAKLPEPEEIPEAWRREGAILCIAGRGPLDEISAMLLAQILRKHGLGARVVPNQAASRREIGTLDMTGVRMVCVCSVELQGTLQAALSAAAAAPPRARVADARRYLAG
ncbi:hypothetical protein ACFQU7_20355 [Pseudoroseomonas wenyumeiae]